jgi:CPA2 family monovalent cation:H+ antiporter-2
MLVLKYIVIIFALSTLVNFIFTKIKVPTIIGYLLTGIIAGPYFLKLINDTQEIKLMSEIGIILLMFTIGMEFSLNHLLRIRKIVFLGGFLQIFLTILVTSLFVHIFKLNWLSSFFIGFLISLSSTAVVLKILQERSELTSNYGRSVVGILIFQDIIVIPFLIFLPVFNGNKEFETNQLLILIVKTIFILGFVYAGNRWIMPKLLKVIAFTRNQELFLMTVLLICLSIAYITSLIGMSLAFGAFIAGLMISESEYSHSAFGNIVSFKDTFTSFFFVSIGMLLDINFVIENLFLVIIIVLIVVIIKSIIAGTTAFVLGHTLRGVVLVGIALSQIGEFSFIIANEGIKLSIINKDIFQLFLSVAIITMSITPLLMRVSLPLANRIIKLQLPKYLIEGLFPLDQIEVPEFSNHLVLIGKDSRSTNLSIMSKYMNLPYISIVFDPFIARRRQQLGETVIYGDAVNEPILLKAHTDKAEVVVISIGNLITSMSVIEKVRSLNKHAHIIVRTKYVTDIDKLYKIGANQVIPEEFETAIELFKRILNQFLIPQKEISLAIAKIREKNYGIFLEQHKQSESIVLKELPNIEIVSYKLDDNSKIINKSMIDVQFRKTFEVTLVAILRNNILIEHPKPSTVFLKGDIIYIIGTPSQISNAIELLEKNIIDKKD